MDNTNSNNEITLQIWNLIGILDEDIRIPAYQRDYCWSEKNVRLLLDDLKNLKEEEEEYRLGTIILQKKKDENNNEYYEIIDGQQRLITLALLEQQLANPKDIKKILQQEIKSDTEREYIAYNKHIIKTYLDTLGNISINKLTKLTFNVLILGSETKLDLAYTFFSNQNSKGCPLTDFDLLKAHHLRYVFDEEQSRHLASNWDKMLLEGQSIDEVDERDYERTLAIYIFRLRKWLGFEDWDEKEKFLVKKEFEAARIIKEIPPFGEQFQYKEPIQGGAHFFAYVAIFVERFKNFKSTKQYEILHNTLNNETHYWVRDAVEALLFAYYLKFGNDYLAEALVLLLLKISKVRYDNSRLSLNTLFDYVKKSKITYYIDIATSPTFLFAELLNDMDLIYAQNKLKDESLKGIQKRFLDKQKYIFKELQESNLFKTEEIKNLITNIMSDIKR